MVILNDVGKHFMNRLRLLVAHHLLLLFLELLLRLLFLCWFILGWFRRQNLLLFSQSQLNVAWRRHVRVDATVSTVCSTTQAGSAVDLKFVHVIHMDNMQEPRFLT